MKPKSAKSRRKASKGVTSQKTVYNPLRLVPSYRGQCIDQLWVGTNPQPLTTTVTTGAIAISASMDPINDINGWATRFQSLFVEYRVVKVRAVIQLFSTNNAGVLNFWVRTSGGAPTQTEALSQHPMQFAAADVNGRHEIVWVPTDPIDLEYKATSVSSNPAYVQVYTNNANWGAPIVVTTLGNLQLSFLIQFREYA